MSRRLWRLPVEVILRWFGRFMARLVVADLFDQGGTHALLAVVRLLHLRG